MRKLLVLLALLVSWPAFAGDPITGGVFSNPLANTILVQTPNLIAGTNHEMTFIVSSNTAANVTLELRNTDNTATVWSQAVLLPANGTFDISITKFGFPGNGDPPPEMSLRVRLLNSITGLIQATLLID
jgi:hypothetical protein